MLNDYRDEVARFLTAVAPGSQVQDVLQLFQKELSILQRAVEAEVGASVRHQIYDLLFLVMEMAAVAGVDLDTEWEQGAKRKEAEYLR